MKLKTYIPHLLHKADSKIVAVFEKTLSQENMTLFEWRVLVSLYNFKEMRFGELASVIAIEPPTLARILSAMEDRQLVVRRSGESDKRVRLVKATEAGLRLAEKLFPAAEEHEKKLLAGFTDDEIYMLRRMLERIDNNILSGDQ